MLSYGARLCVGYRFYDKKRTAPLFPCGFGLSYTTFADADLQLSAPEIGPDETLEVAIAVTNTGARAGQEVVPVYVRAGEARLLRPDNALKPFAQVALAPGERQIVTRPLNQEPLAYCADRAHQWVAEAGRFAVLGDASAQDIRAVASFLLTQTARWQVGPG